jgi:ubiquinone/menaquinone biosynthesis C-methylase UbiE
MPDFQALTEVQKAIWDAGDLPALAPLLEDASAAVVDRLGVAADHDYLDVATGSGNAAILGARRGARTTGLDLVPRLIDAARQRSADEGLDVEWLVGDAQDLPFADDSFDRVSSVFGAMFAPDHPRAAAELVRVCRPGGLVAVTAWTPEGLNGRMFMRLGQIMGPPPEGVQPPILWGTEDHVRELFAGHEVETERRMLVMEHESMEAWQEEAEAKIGSLVLAKAALEPQGRWGEVRDEMRAIYDEANEATGGAVRVKAEYLLTTVTVR